MSRLARVLPSWCLVASLTVLGLAPAPSAARAADLFRSETGRFSVRLPAPPHRSSSSQATLAGRIESAEYLVETGAVELRVELHDVPTVASLLLSDGALLERAENDLLADDRAEDERAVATQLQGHPAREVRYRLGGGDGREARALLVLVGRRLYIAVALHPPAVDDASVDRFFGSFAVWGR